MSKLSAWLAGTALVCVSVGVSAQTVTYNLNIVSDLGVTPEVVDFAGSFTFNPDGTALCSAGLCDPNEIPAYSNVHVSDAGVVHSFQYMTSNAGLTGFGLIDFYDPNAQPPTDSSSRTFLGFSLPVPLNEITSTTTLESWSYDGGDGMFRVGCGIPGGGPYAYPPDCTTMTLTPESASQAPEIDPGVSGTALTLLAGMLALIIDRRTQISGLR